jgi:phosphoesterase RecJ-like protein
MNEKEVQELNVLLEQPKKIAIIPHRNPDGDAMGSTLGLSHFLRKLGHSTQVISPNEFPEFLAWLPGSEEVMIYEKNRNQCTDFLNEQDLIFTLDFNALHRTGEMEFALNTLKIPMVMIDHHELPSNYAQFVFSDTAYGSTCEMVYHFIQDLKLGHLIDKTIATCLYTGIMTDSGQFRFPKTTGTTHRIVAEFIDLGVPNTEIPTLLFDNNSYDRLQLMGRALQNMKIFPELHSSYTTLSQDELNQFNYVKGDTEGIVNYGLTIKGIQFTAIFIEHKDEGIVKISFRSQGNFDVNQFARTYFNGGGHINAAGGKSTDTLENTILRFENILTTIHPK